MANHAHLTAAGQMNVEIDQDLCDRAKALYETRIKALLELNHQNAFVAIEPDSEDFFLGETFSEAIGRARQKYPDRLTFTVRVGHQAAVHLGVMMLC